VSDREWQLFPNIAPHLRASSEEIRRAAVQSIEAAAEHISDDVAVRELLQVNLHQCVRCSSCACSHKPVFLQDMWRLLEGKEASQVPQRNAILSSISAFSATKLEPSAKADIARVRDRVDINCPCAAVLSDHTVSQSTVTNYITFIRKEPLEDVRTFAVETLSRWLSQLDRLDSEVNKLFTAGLSSEKVLYRSDFLFYFFVLQYRAEYFACIPIPL
jgi:hypothetical protein